MNRQPVVHLSLELTNVDWRSDRLFSSRAMVDCRRPRGRTSRAGDMMTKWRASRRNSFAHSFQHLLDPLLRYLAELIFPLGYCAENLTSFLKKLLQAVS